MRMKTDVLIVGGGPAGLTTAKFLAEGGVDTILLESDSSFYRKACGEGITSSLAGYDFFDLYESRKGIERITETLTIRMTPGDIELGVTNILTNKRDVEEELARQAMKNGADIRMGERVRSLIRTNGTVTVEPQDIEAKVVVGADGFHSIVRKFMGIERPAQYGIAGSGSWTGEPPGDTCIVEFKKAVANYGYAWRFPRKNDWNIGIGTIKPPLYREQRDTFLTRFPDVTGWRTGTVPLSMPLRSYGKNTILVGDSASQIVSAFADGILPAMICAKKAAEELIKMSDQGFKSNDLSGYERAWQKTLGKTFRDGHLAFRMMMGLYFSETLLYHFMRRLGRLYD